MSLVITNHPMNEQQYVVKDYFLQAFIITIWPGLLMT